MMKLAITFTALFLLAPQIVFGTYATADSELSAVVGGTGHSTASLTDKIGVIIPAAFSILGVLFLVLAVYAGFRWMLARGNEDQITEARTTLTNATVGLVIVVSGYAITNFVTQRLINQQPDTGGALGGSAVAEDIGCCRIELTTQWACSVQTFSQCEQFAKGKTNMNFGSLEGFAGQDENFTWDKKYDNKQTLEQFTAACQNTCNN